VDREAGGGRRKADAGSGLSAAERELVRSIEENLSEEIAFLEKVVNTDSATYNVAGVREVGALFQRELETLGFETRWASMPESMHRAGHLIAEQAPEKSTGRKVLLIGHLDTIYEGRPFERSGETVRGAGVTDMKGGAVALLFAVKALDAAGMLADSTVRILFTGDEENPGSPTEVARRDLVDTARQSDVALSFESDSGKIAIGRRGLSTWDLDVTGAGGHSANVLRPRRGAGAIYEASRILNRFREAFSDSPNVTVNPGLFLGGTDVA
jgi:glutamate carboxypeptidase